jgi:hypothetical protein
VVGSSPQNLQLSFRFAERIEPIVSNFCLGLADDDRMYRLRRDPGRPDARCVWLARLGIRLIDFLLLLGRPSASGLFFGLCFCAAVFYLVNSLMADGPGNAQRLILRIS